MIAAPEAHHTTPRPDFVHLLQIVRGEFLEMPGLRLTRRQAQRLWSIDALTCDAILDTLEESRFLRRTRDNDYMLGFRDS